MKDRENIRLLVSLFIAGVILAILLFILKYVNIFQGFYTPPPQTVSPASSNLSSLDDGFFSYGERNIFDNFSSSDIDQGVKAFKTGKYSESIKLFSRTLKENKNLPDIKIYLSNAKVRLSEKKFTLAVVVPAKKESDLAREMLRGVADAQAKFNEQGGLNNRLLQIIIANDGDNEDQARQIAKKLAANKDILGVIGHNNGKNILSALPEYDNANLAIITPSSASSELRNKDYHVFFRATLSDKILAEKLAYYIKTKLNLEKLTVFYNHGDSSSLSFKKFLEEKFQGDVSLEMIKIDDIDENEANKTIQNLVKREVKTAILLPGVNYVNKARLVASGNSKLPQGSKLQLFGSTIFNRTDILISQNGDNNFNDLIVVVPWFAEVDKAKLFAEEAQQRWDNIITFRTAFSFDATQAFIKAFSKSSAFDKPNPSREDILRNIESINVSETSGEPLAFKDGERISGKPILIKVVRNNKSKYDFKLIE
jgi:ABC-type branched-subunit amino acid transport system substrate-binding protein